ncbi:MAG: DUF5777 family beta-barrel protein [Blastocatellia bacterium]|nr:DUF5777 family beta-barrel protein [Blastocatellia bacterium]
MSKTTLVKILIVVASTLFIAANVQARPEYLRIFSADPLSRPELRGKCSLCHTSPEGGGPRNEFGKAFASAGFVITADLRKRFPDNFLTEAQAQQGRPPVSFVPGSDAEAIVEIGGKKFVINTKTKTVTEMAAARPEERVAAATPAPTPQKQDAPENIYRQVDVRLINLPTAIPIAKGSFWNDFTHRFPFGDPTNAASLYGLDTAAIPSFGFMYGVTDRIHIGGYRSPGDVGRPIELYAGASVLDEHKGDPVSLMARVGIEGRDNFKRNFTTSFEFAFARSITRHAQIYVVPTISVGDRPLNVDVKTNAPGETAYALGIGGALNIRPSVALMAEANYRLNEKARYVDGISGIRRPVFGFGLQKASASRRHAFSLVFTNGPGTTMSQRSMTRGLFFSDDSARGLTIGFNLSRRIF